MRRWLKKAGWSALFAALAVGCAWLAYRIAQAPLPYIWVGAVAVGLVAAAALYAAVWAIFYD